MKEVLRQRACPDSYLRIFDVGFALDQSQFHVLHTGLLPRTCLLCERKTFPFSQTLSCVESEADERITDLWRAQEYALTPSALSILSFHTQSMNIAMQQC